METPQPLSIESFSYSWSVNVRSRRNSGDTSDEASSFIEMDPTLPPSKRFFTLDSLDFEFPFPISPPPRLTFADELTSNGFLMPLFFDSPATEACEAMELESAVLDAAPTNLLEVVPECSSFRKSCRRFPRRILQKYLDFLRPLLRKIQGCGVKGEKIEASGAVKKNLSDEWRRSCDSESSIYEAVLHCKRSIGK